MKQIVWIALGGLFLLTTAQPASFDCAKATSKIEILICSDAELSKLDEELNSTYRTATKDKLEAKAIRSAQRQWLIARDDCADTSCVKQFYESRLSALKNDNQSTSPYSHCYPNETTYFTCLVGFLDKFVSLCSGPNHDENKLQFRLGKKGGLEFVYPSDLQKSLSSFTGVDNYNRELGHRNTVVTFHTQGKMYSLEDTYGEGGSFRGLNIKVGNGTWQEMAEGGWNNYSCIPGSDDVNLSGIAGELDH